MPSDAKKKKEAAKKNVRIKKDQRGKAKSDDNNNNESANTTQSETGLTPNISANSLTRLENDDAAVMANLTGKMSKVKLLEEQNAANRACTGVLTTHPNNRDVHIHDFSLTFYGQELLVDANLELNNGRRYGIIGLNGCGKSTMLAAIARKEVPIPESVSVFHLSREIAATDMSAIDAVLEAEEEIAKLEFEAEKLALCTDTESQDLLEDIYNRLDALQSDEREIKAGRLLHGLGFTAMMQKKACKDFSGGWRMRIALARALYLSPALLLLDEPTNHLDLETNVWLENELAQYPRCLVLISHSQDFLNNVCTNIMHMDKSRLTYYQGNYDQFMKTRAELETNQAKKYQWEQDQIANMKNYIARFGHGSAKLARQAQSKEKTLKKMVDSGLTEKVETEVNVGFKFLPCGVIPPPVLAVQNISFKYPSDAHWIYQDLSFGLDLDSRVALVGPNGAGKSTLLKLIDGRLQPTGGIIRRNSHLKIGCYHQHLAEEMDLEMTALDYMMQEFPDVKQREEMRSIIGRYGLSGRQQICPMKNLSDGQRCRVAFAWLANQRPQLLLLDEPTNHLDIETIDALAEAVNEYEGGMVLVSHDFRLINQVAKEIWICEHRTINKWTSDIASYKKQLKSKVCK